MGFEFETSNKAVFENIIEWYKDSIVSLDDMIEINTYQHHRVNFLDRADIEDLGWTRAHYKGACCYENGFFKLFWFETSTVSIDKVNMQIFRGTIRNKTELKRLMKQIGIWNK